jgi:hypothetical protein
MVYCQYMTVATTVLKDDAENEEGVDLSTINGLENSLHVVMTLSELDNAGLYPLSAEEMAEIEKKHLLEAAFTK